MGRGGGVKGRLNNVKKKTTIWYWRASPRYLSNLLGHRGPGSLISHLKKKGLAHHVVATHKNFFMARFLQ